MIDVDRAALALHCIDAGIDRDDWVKALTAFKAAGGDESTARTWSESGNNYDARAFNDTWRSIKANGGIGPGTLFHLAKAHGWSDNGHKPDFAEIERQRQAREAVAAAEAEATRQAQERTAGIAAQLWQAAAPAAGNPYLERKGVQTTDTLRQIEAATAAGIMGYAPMAKGEALTGNLLLVPIKRDGQLVSAELIAENGLKAALQGQGTKAGGYWLTGKADAPETILIGEGVATSLSAHMATGTLAAAAFSNTNLRNVAESLRQQYPDARLVILADVDKTNGQPDRHAAAATQAVSGLLAVPDFGANRASTDKDFNDLHQAQGLDAVKACIATAQPAAPAELPDRVILLSAADLRPEPIRWLWHGWLAQGKFHLLAGAPGVGKTTLTLALAATVSMGGRWPDGSQCEPGNVLVWSGEDDVADTLLPRLMAAGANARRVHFVGEAHRKGEKAPFNLARDMPLLQQAAQRIGNVKLLIVDPVAGAVTGDSHKSNEVRNGLQPLVDFASATGCAVLGITHFGKGGQGGDPTNRVLGSVAFAAVARVVLVAAKAKDADGRAIRIIARSKGNVTPDDGGYQYHLEQVSIDGGIETTAVAWGSKVEGTAQELLTDPDAPEGDAGEIADAASMLKQLLVSNCDTPAKDAIKELTDAGFTKKQIRKAREKLAVISKKGGMHGGWYWRLPYGCDPDLPAEDALLPPEDAQGAHFLKQGILGTFDTIKGTFGENPNTESGSDFVEETL